MNIKSNKIRDKKIRKNCMTWIGKSIYILTIVCQFTTVSFFFNHELSFEFCK